MKNWLKKNIYRLCNGCLALSILIIFGTPSNFLFGEPEFPFED